MQSFIFLFLLFNFLLNCVFAPHFVSAMIFCSFILDDSFHVCLCNLHIFVFHDNFIGVVVVAFCCNYYCLKCLMHLFCFFLLIFFWRKKRVKIFAGERRGVLSMCLVILCILFNSFLVNMPKTFRTQLIFQNCRKKKRFFVVVGKIAS